jgi:hypothetical protein
MPRSHEDEVIFRRLLSQLRSLLNVVIEAEKNHPVCDKECECDFCRGLNDSSKLLRELNAR